MRGLVAIVFVGCSYDPAPIEPTDNGDAPDPGPVDASSGVTDGSTIDAAIDAPPNQVSCPGSQCGAVCCTGVCAASLCTTGKIYECDGPEDCPGQVCCNNQNTGSSCAATCANASPEFEACHTSSDCSFGCGDCGFRTDYGQNVCCE